MSRAIVTVGISQARIFGPYLERFERTFRQYGGADYLKLWHREWPPESPTHDEVHYGFKVYAVLEAWRRGYESVLWFDCSCWAIRSLAPLWERLERSGHILIPDENALGSWSSDRSLAEFGVTRDQAMDIHLMSGTCFGLDLRHERSRAFLERLRTYATPEHFNGTHKSRHPDIPAPADAPPLSMDPRYQGHRADEVYAALIARELSMAVQPTAEFAGGGSVSEEACVRSGYDLPLIAGPDTYEERLPKRARKLEVMEGDHTIDTALLTPGGWVLDAGCSDFSFARDMVALGCRVVALDADPTVEDPGIEGVAYFNLALSDEPGERELVMTVDPQARYLAPPGTTVQADRRTVQAATITALMETLGVPQWDAVKLDIEGSEYGVLLRWPGPIARQISIEFHEHCSPRSQAVYDAIFEHLGQWYEIVQHVRDQRYRAGWNYWDSLLTLR